MTPPLDLITTDGYDLQFGTNVLGAFLDINPESNDLMSKITGHFYFTELLMPALFAGKETSPDGHARIVTTSSMAAYLDNKIYWDTLVDGPKRKKLGQQGLYIQSKFVRFWTCCLPLLSADERNDSQTSSSPAKSHRDTGTRAFCRCLAIQVKFIIAHQQIVFNIPDIVRTGNLRTDLQRYMSAWQIKIMVSSPTSPHPPNISSFLVSSSSLFATTYACAAFNRNGLSSTLLHTALSPNCGAELCPRLSHITVK